MDRGTRISSERQNAQEGAAGKPAGAAPVLPVGDASALLAPVNADGPQTAGAEQVV
jgi:hypothetical protein